MAKRKLNKQQRSRIAQNHDAALANTSDCLPGIIAVHFGGEVEVMATHEGVPVDTNTLFRCHLRANLPSVVCGDHVLWRPAAQHAEAGVIEALENRYSVINRPRPYHEPKPVAANIDLILLVIAPQPAPIINLIDRYLIAAENARIDVALLINKSDLLSEAGDLAGLTELQNLVELYHGLGYPVFHYQSGHNDERTAVPLPAVAVPFDPEQVLGGKTSILVGQSGVGKSSVINKLCGQHVANIGQISQANEKGRHTTTNARLYFLGDGKTERLSAIIDSPGIREFALWHLSQQDIIDGMPEFREYASRCRFRDCEHGKSAGCVLQQAFDNGEIHPYRVASYKHILTAQKD